MNALYVFDFDDCLAKTEGEIGVSFKLRGHNWDEADKFLDALRVPYTAVHDGMIQVFYIGSDDHAIIGGELKKLRGQGVIVREDFSNFAQVHAYELKPKIVQWLRMAKADTDNEVCILTARATDGMNLRSLFRGLGNISTNARDIQQIIRKELGVDIPVYAVGDKGKDVADEKRNTIYSLVSQHRPREVHMFDDSSRNLAAIEELCGRMGCKLITHKVSAATDGIEQTSTCENFLRLFAEGRGQYGSLAGHSYGTGFVSEGGTYIDVGVKETHDDFVRDHPEMFGLEPGEELGDYATDAVIPYGWLRVARSGDILYVGDDEGPSYIGAWRDSLIEIMAAIPGIDAVMQDDKTILTRDAW